MRTLNRLLLVGLLRTNVLIDRITPQRLALTRYLEDGAVPVDNNQIENLIQPWALSQIRRRTAVEASQ
ncbi:hypothetical protein PS922_00878 [Pseudomonas fluorescens]|uniref:Transposase IS66 central domain-containing protein n=1 Tax=Pseudomonas fluorescens TaxID=294 RepID=A0A5E7RDD9_PSEFL|nr:hypothetical protein PS922_00878 [Pseudomonas fluorescens]